MFEIQEIRRRQTIHGSTIVTYQIVVSPPAVIRATNGGTVCTGRALTFEIDLKDGNSDWLGRSALGGADDAA